MFSYFRFRFQRGYRRFRRDIRLLRQWTVNYFERNVWGKWRQLGIIRRLVLVWWGIFFLTAAGTILQTLALRDLYTVAAPVAGGQYIEGIVGTVKNINPVLPESSAASDVSRLIFSGLVRYTPDRQLEGDLAESWAVSPDGKTYTFRLRPGIKWHDDVPLTAQDVLFTLVAIQNPDSRSPLAPAWQGVKAEAPDELTVVMTLPAPYAAFIHQATVGIVPSHLLETTEPSRLRVAPFNQRPVGSGPFRFKAISQDGKEIQLEAYESYHGGRPKLDRFSFRLFGSLDDMIDAYAKRQITGLSRLRPDQAADDPRLPEVRQYHLLTTDVTGVFMRAGNNPLTELPVRTALAAATDRQEIIQAVYDGRARTIKLPLLPGQLGYTSRFQPSAFNVAVAESRLDAAGWKRDGSSRSKNGKPLKLTLVTSNSRDHMSTGEVIKRQWQRIGVEVELVITDTANLQQSYIRPRRYDVLLYGISIGADPDVYPYWHSSQAEDPGLNLSGWANGNADKALESARITTDAETRAAKYGSFLANWASDVPAVMLYATDYIYGASDKAAGIVARKIIEPSDRFYGVEDWTIRTRSARK